MTFPKINNSTTTLLPWVEWALAALFVVFNYIQLVFPGLAAPNLPISFTANEGTLSTISAAYFYTYALLQIPVGIIVDRFGAKKPLFLAINCLAIGTLLFSVVNNPVYALIVRIIMGAGAAFSFLGCLKLIQEWFPARKFSTLVGMTNTAGMLGAASGPFIVWGINSVGWRECLVSLGIAQLVLAVLVWLIVYDRNIPSYNESKSVSRSINGKGKVGIVDMLCNKQFLLNATYATGMGLVFVAFGGLWGSSYIMKYYEIDSIHAADIGSFLFLGAILGSLFFGWLPDRIKSRKKPMVFAAFGGITSLSIMLYVNNLPIPIFTVILFLVGVFGSANIMSCEFAEVLYPKFAGLSIGISSTIFFAGSAFSQQIIGFLLEHHSSYVGIQSLSRISTSDYQFAFSSLIVFMLISVISSLLIKEPI
jgi:MFS family permease